jgi:acyl-CoA synthetase (AMP-forming)/AMP-acid ligase II
LDGKNHYSHDIERTVERSHPAIRLAGCAVFSIIDSLSEQIIVIAEIENKHATHSEQIIRAIRHAVAFNHDLHVDDIKLTNPGDIPRTTSGKIRHFLCKTNYMAEAFKEIKSI